MSGGAGVSGINTSQWKDVILNRGGASLQLREAMPKLTMRLENTNVLWDDKCALKAKKMIALDKCPGIRPIGIGDAADQLCAKVTI